MSKLEIPTIDVTDDDFKEKLNFNLWSTHSSTDHRNDRERPYDGQPQTAEGERGKTLVEGLTMRDIVDCMVQGFLAASCDPELRNKTMELNDDWRYQDIYKFDIPNIDPGAIIKRTMCFIEHMMSIYPNVPKITDAEISRALTID